MRPDRVFDLDLDRLSSAILELLTALLLLTALVAGGSTTSPLATGAARLAAIPVLALAMWRCGAWPPLRDWLWPVLLLGAIVVLLLIQLAPLPPEIWTTLPGRRTVMEGYAAVGLALPALPISLAPQSTLDSLLGLLPPAAVFLAVLGLGDDSRRRLGLLVGGVALVSIGLGMLQVAGGPDSPLRLYAFTNRDSGVGFFANRNHQASFLAAAIPLTAAAISRRALGQGSERMATLILVAAAVVLMVGVAVTRSRAGVLLLAPALVGALLIAARGRRMDAGLAGWVPVATLGGGILVAAGLVAAFSFSPLASRFAAEEETRPQLARAIFDAGFVYAPFGSGVGSFEPVYRIHEPADFLLPAFVNHAHNDYVETWLEAGWAGVALIAAFLAWWGVAVAGLARDWAARGGGLQAAGATIVGIFLLHSLVDYPLRMPAGLTLFGLACALMVAPSWRDSRRFDADD